MAGRRPKPTALKLINGNPGKRPINKNEPQPKAGASIPVWAQENPLIQEHWDMISTELEAMGVLTVADSSALVIYCETLINWLKASKMVRSGLVTKDPSGKYIVNPAFDMQMKLQKELRALLTEFGLTPSSRTKVNAIKKEEVNPFSRFA